MAVLGFEYTSNLVDLLLSPHGSSPLFQNLVPRQFQEKSLQEKIDELECHLVSHGLNQESISMLLEAGVRSLQLLALLSTSDLYSMFRSMLPQQRRLLEVSIRRLDPRPPYHVTAGLQRYLVFPNRRKQDLSNVEDEIGSEQKVVKENHTSQQSTLALQLLESSKKILECPVCYLTCLPPRIWQCGNGHLTCDTCHHHTRSCPLCRTPFSNVRPLTAERLASQIPTPCRNQIHGCDTCLPWSDRQLHEAECDLAMGHCPVLSCTSQVQLSRVVEHLTSVHSWSEDFVHHKLDPDNLSFSSSISTTTYLHSLQDQQNWWWGPQCIGFDGNMFFLLISRRVENQVTGYFNFWIWVAGNQRTARRYRYCISVEGGDCELVTYTAAPVCLETGLEEIREHQTSLLLSDGAVKRLIRANERLHYSVKFYKSQ